MHMGQGAATVETVIQKIGTAMLSVNSQLLSSACTMSFEVIVTHKIVLAATMLTS